ncbi:MAG: peptidylprolyl isomerase [Verrucomicrobiales bacterium]
MKPVVLAVAIAGLSLTSCSMLKSGYNSVAKGTGAAWDAMAGAGGAVVNATANVGKKTGRLMTGKLKADPTIAEVSVNLDGRVGIILIELDDAAAPQHAENFRKLAKKGYYNDLGVHRAVPNHLIQTGDPRSKHENARAVWGLGGPGHTVPAEIKLPHRRGSVGMARLGDRLNPTKQSNGSQFYICLKSLPELDGGYTVFGRVVSGIEFADAISKTSTDDNDAPLKMVKVERIRMIDSTAAAEPAAATAPVAPAPAPKADKKKQPAAAPAAAPTPATEPAPEKKKGWFKRMLGGIW